METVTGKNFDDIEILNLPYEISPFGVFKKVCHSFKNAYLLESMEGPEKLAEYSFIGFKPVSMIRSKNTTVLVMDQSFQIHFLHLYLSPIQLL
jgi:anthranilate/para-aminobenzoate synthase component I